MTQSTTHKDYPITKDYPRTDLIFQCVKLIKMEDKTELSVIYQQNLGFWIPNFILYQAMKWVGPKFPTLFDLDFDYQEKLIKESEELD
jgi:hypothetical protein